VTVPEVTALLMDKSAAAAPEQAYETPVTALAAVAPEHAYQTPVTALAAPTGSASKLAPADRDFLIHKGDEMLARGDVTGARLVFERAAESGDARAANGMARTFDPKVLRMLRVFGIRPDPEKAALWYARSKALETYLH
jgi:TPR repeat protein